MKLLAVTLADGLVAGGWFVFGDWQDPRTAGPAPIPERYLESQGGMRQGTERGGRGRRGGGGLLRQRDLRSRQAPSLPGFSCRPCRVIESARRGGRTRPPFWAKIADRDTSSCR